MASARRAQPGLGPRRAVQQPALVEQLLQALVTNNVAALEAALAAGASADTRIGGRANHPVLYAAAGGGLLGCVKALVAAGASVNVHAESRRRYRLATREALEALQKEPVHHLATPLHAAAGGGHLACLQALLAAGGEVAACDGEGQQPVHRAAAGGHIECIEALVGAGARLDASDEQEETVLHKAADGGHVDCAKYLLAAGVPVHAAQEDGQLAIHSASWQGHTKVVQLLVAAGSSINTQDASGETPLHMACWNGHAASVGALVEAGASLNLRAAQGETPLCEAAENSHSGCAALLVKAGADVNLGGQQATVVDNAKRDMTALHYAAMSGDRGLVELLLAAGANPGAANSADETPLHLAAEAGHYGVVAALLEAGSPVDAVAGGDITPLHLAVYNGRADCVALLLKTSTAVNAVAEGGATPLAAACHVKDTGILTMLLHAGADPNHTKVYPPLHAAVGGSADSMAILIAAGARLDAPMDGRGTALASALLHEAVPCVALLLAAGAAVDESMLRGELRNPSVRTLVQHESRWRRRRALALVREQRVAARDAKLAAKLSKMEGGAV